MYPWGLRIATAYGSGLDGTLGFHSFWADSSRQHQLVVAETSTTAVDDHLDSLDHAAVPQAHRIKELRHGKIKNSTALLRSDGGSSATPCDNSLIGKYPTALRICGSYACWKVGDRSTGLRLGCESSVHAGSFSRHLPSRYRRVTSSNDTFGFACGGFPRRVSSNCHQWIAHMHDIMT